VLTTGVSPAEAKTACWRQVLQDWFLDGRLDKRYTPKCLNEASNHIPDDLKQYSSLDDEILRQRRQGARTLAFTGGTPQCGATIEPGDGLFRQAFTKTNPRNADSMPLPLLILSGLALLLVAGGAAGLVSRRLRARRAQA
jgi:hypothetical protein